MNFKEFEDIVVAEFPELTPEMLGKYEAMEALYEEWNAKINVISRKDIGGLYLHHVLHSLAIASYLKRRRPEVYSAWTEGASVLDLGTGGGFPGIPLAVMFPNVRFTLCDSVCKKIIVASEVSKALSLGNVTTVNARAESLSMGEGQVLRKHSVSQGRGHSPGNCRTDEEEQTPYRSSFDLAD